MRLQLTHKQSSLPVGDPTQYTPMHQSGPAAGRRWRVSQTPTRCCWNEPVIQLPAELMVPPVQQHGSVIMMMWGLPAPGGAHYCCCLCLVLSASQLYVLCALHVLQFEFNYSLSEKPNIQNDTVTLHRKAAKDHQVSGSFHFQVQMCVHPCSSDVFSWVGTSKWGPASYMSEGQQQPPPLKAPAREWRKLTSSTL